MIFRKALGMVPLYAGLLFVAINMVSMVSEVRADSPTHKPSDKEPDDDDCDEGDKPKPDCEKCPKKEDGRDDCGKSRAGDPFYLHNGEFYLKEMHLEQPGSDELHFTVRYSSFSEANDVLGLGWTFNYRMQLYERNDGKLVVRKSNGQRYVYASVGGGKYRLQSTKWEEITVNGDGSYRLETLDDRYYDFDAQGRLTKLGNGDGEEVRITYEGSVKHAVSAVAADSNVTTPMVVARDWRIEKVEGYRGGVATGAFLEFEYDASGHLESVSDQGGREVTLSYTSEGRLEEITGEGGETTTFTYYGGTGTNKGLLETYVGSGCSDCVLTRNEYDSQRRVWKQFRGATGQGTELQVTYSTSYTDVLHKIKNASGTVVRQMEERVNFVTDPYGRRRVSKHEVKRGTTWGAAQNHVTEYVFGGTAGTPGYGRIVEETKPNGGKIFYTYNAQGQIDLQEEEVVSGGRRLVTDNEYDTSGNRVKEEKYYSDETGVKFVKEWVYDGANRVTQEKRKQADGSYVTKGYEYYTSGEHEGLVKIVTDECGHEMQYEYTGTANAPAPKGLLKREYDPLNTSRQTTYGYDANGFRTSRTDALGRVTSYEYDDEGRMTKQTNADGSETVWTYVGANLTEIKTGKTGVGYRYVRYQYNGLNQQTKVLRVNDASQEVMQKEFVYDTSDRVLVEKNALSQQTLFTYEPIGWLTKIEQPDSTGSLAATQIEYDKGGRQTRVTNALGVVNEMSYDLLNRQTLKKEAVGLAEERWTGAIRDVLGNDTLTDYLSTSGTSVGVTRKYYDRLGRLIGVNWNPANSLPDSDGLRLLPKKMEYDGCGNLTAEIDGKGNRTEYEYNRYDERVKTKYADRANYTGGNDSEIDYDLVGNVVREKGGRGISQYMHYDEMNRPVHQSIPTTGTLSGSWWTTSSNVLKSTTYNVWGQVVNTANLVGGTTGATYDAFGRTTTRTNEAGLVVALGYNALDAVTSEQYPSLPGQGSGTSKTYSYNSNNGRLLDSITDRSGNTTLFEYDALSQKAKITTSLGGQTVTIYDGVGRAKTQSISLPGSSDPSTSQETTRTFNRFSDVLTVEHPDESETTYTYNAYGLVATESGAGVYPHSYTYDLAGNRTTLTTQFGSTPTDAVTTWEYDSRNRPRKKILADSSYYEYTYDETGNLKTRRDAKNVTTTYSFNMFNQLSGIDYPSDADVSFGYDLLGRRTSLTDGSRSGGPSAEWTYDSANRVTNYKQHAVDRQITYTYQGEGGRLTMSVDKISTSGTTWQTGYTYDAAGKLQTIVDAQTGTFSYGWHADADLVSQITMPGGTRQTKSYDGLARLTEIKALTSGSSTINRFAYGYDKLNRRQEVTLADSSKIDYGYDVKNQITSAVSDTDTNYNFDYQFDSTGNWLSGDVGITGGAPIAKTFTPNALNQYEIVGSGTLTYDENGNMTHPGTVTYDWSQENRLVNVSSGSSSYVYDGMGRRVQSVEAGTTTRYLYDGLVPIMELDGSNAVTRTVTRGLDLSNTREGFGGTGGVLASKTASNGGNYFYDGNGNVVDVVDASNTSVAHYQYDPFGSKVAATGSYASQPYQWSTKEFSGTTGLVYYLFRFYAPDLGRWINRDPIEEAGSLNSYAIVGNNCVDDIDIFGLTEVDDKVIGYAIETLGPGSSGGVPFFNFFREAPPLTIPTSMVQMEETDIHTKMREIATANGSSICAEGSVKIDQIAGGVQTIHLWSLGRINVRVKGTLTCMGKHDGTAVYSFHGTIEPLTDHFDFNWDPSRGANAQFVAVLGAIGQTFVGALSFDINFTGPVKFDMMGTVKCGN